MLWMKGLAFMLLAGLPWIAMAEEPAKTDAPPAPMSENVADNTFDILEYAIEGNTVLPALAIEEAVYPHLGEKKSIKDVEQARLSLEKTYHNAGYLTVLVDIPEQEVKSGLIRLRVTESSVSRLKVSGARYYSLGRIKEKAPSLAEGSVPYFPDVQTELAALTRGRDRLVAPVLRAGKTPGTVEVELKVKDQLPLHGSVELNDSYSANTTHTRLSGQIRYDNLWQREHSLSLLFQTAPEKPEESNVFSGTYVIPGDNGQAYALYMVRSRSNVAAVGDYTALGKGNFFGFRWIRPLRALDGYSHSMNLGVDYKDSAESVVGSADTISSPITYTPLSAQYIGNWAWAPQTLTQFDIAANFNLRGQRNNESEFANKRYKAQGNYFYLRGGVQHTQGLGGWTLYTKLDGQAASGPLISNEQFTAGGAASVRGYLESEALGDYGVHGALEVRSPSFLPEALGPGQLYALAFVEGARLRLLSPLPQQQSRFLLSSSGVGVRLKAAKGLSVNIDWALPFKSLTYTQARESRLHAKVAYEF